MRTSFRHVATALAYTAIASTVLVAATTSSRAQDATAPGAEQLKQIALTDAQIQHFLAAKKDIDAVIDALPDSAAGQPDAATTAKLDAIAKKNGFANAAEYEVVDGNIELVMAGMDPQTKKYIGTEGAIKQQIAQIQADKTMKPKDKTEALAQLNQALKEAVPVQNPGNVELVTRNYDKIAGVMSQD